MNDGNPGVATVIFLEPTKLFDREFYFDKP
jgi:hypothetical protein